MTAGGGHPSGIAIQARQARLALKARKVILVRLGRRARKDLKAIPVRPVQRVRKGRRLFVGEHHKPVTLEGVRPHGRGVLIKFKTIGTPEGVGQFRNQWVYAKTKDLPGLPEGQHYQHELLGINVMDENGNPLGALKEIMETGANDVYLIRDESGKEILLPNIPSVILELDFARRIMKVHLLEGL